ncbi:hypothetical protein [Companilactobacillus sp.]|uniref:hypothetical protein n=1 Tax=Companilactobacillus sp. TaxID=2767905 RepID=UPI002607535B|nr:hypothetical protein [Companilactobacillus sp.]
MKFKLENLKNKKVIAAIIVVVILIGGFIGYRNHEAADFFKEVKIEFNGYNNHGTADWAKGSELALNKKIALYEGKKPKVNKDMLNTVVDTAQSPDDLISEDKWGTNTMSGDDLIKVQTYLRHMKETHINISESMGLKNGQKIQMSIFDQSPDPFFKMKTKTFTVSGLKKQPVLSMDELEQYIKTKGYGYNHHAEISMVISKKSKPSVHIKSLQLDQTFNVKHDFNYSNGDKLKVSQKKLANVVDQYEPNIKFTYIKGKDVVITVSGLKDGSTTPTNLSVFNDKVLANFHDYHKDDDNSDDNPNITLVKGFLDKEEDTLKLIYKAKANDYYSIEVDDVKLKNNTLRYDGKDIEKTDILDSSATLPETDDMITDKNLNNVKTYSTGSNVIDFNIQ